MYFLYNFLLAIAIAINSFLIYILYQRRQRNIGIVVLIVLLLLINIWFAPKLLTNALHVKGVLFSALSRLSALGYVFVPAAFVTFTFANGSFRKYLDKFFYWVLVLVPSIFFLYLSWTTELIGIHDYNKAQLFSWGYETPTGLLWFHYTIWFDIMMLIGFFTLLHNYLTSNDRVKKRQALYILLIASCPFVIGTITLAILPMLNIFVMPVGVIILNMAVIIGISVVYKFGWFVVTPLSVLSSLNYAIITVDKSGAILQMNPYSERLMSAKASQVTGKNVSQILTVKSKRSKKYNQVRQLLKPVIDKGKSMTFDSYTVTNIKKKTFPLTISITPIYEKTSIIGANIFMRDSSKEKEREKKKDDFLNILSHELKTPITSIKIYNQLLLNELSEKDEKKRQLSMRMANEIDRLTKLIQVSFDLAQLQSGKLRLDKEFFGIDDFITDIVQKLTDTHPERKIFVKEAATGVVVYADKQKLEQVIINLVNNAIKFSPIDSPIIVHRKVTDHFISIGIEDFGKGITPKYQKKIFEQFFQVEHRLTSKTGLGMGLYISSSIIKAHDGKMWVESKVGKGSTFNFSLPKST